MKPGLIIFRRADVDHRNWYCRVKLPKADRYKTISLKTPDIAAAREKAFDHDADVRFRLKHDVPVFNHPFSKVAQEYIAAQEARAKRGEVSAARPKKIKSVIEGRLRPMSVKRRAKGTPWAPKRDPFSRSSSGEARSPQLAQCVAAG